MTSARGTVARPVGEGGDRVRAAHPEDRSAPQSAHAARMTGCAPGRADDDLVDAGDARGDDAHDDRARVRRAPARDVDRRAADGHLAQAHAVALRAARRRRLAPGRPRPPRGRSRPPPRARRARRDRAPRARPELGRRDHAGRRRRRRGARRARAGRRRRRSRTSSTIARTASVTETAPGASARTRRAVALGVAERQALNRHAGAPARRRSPSALSLCATGLAISRAVARAISSRTTSPFSRSVVPVAVRSTIASTRPVSGASSTEPLTSTISAWRPGAARTSARRCAGTWWPRA